MLFALAAGLAAASALKKKKQRKAAQKEAKRQEAIRKAAYDRAQALSSAAGLQKNIRGLADMFRADVASGYEPQMRESVARALGTSGLAETGVGAMLANASRVAPGLSAFSQALQAGQQLSARQSDIELARATGQAVPRPTGSIFGDLSSGLSTGAQFYSLMSGKGKGLV